MLENTTSSDFCAPRHDRALADHLEDSLQNAFPPIDAPQDALAHLADTPPDSALLDVLDPPNYILLEELIRQVTGGRIVIIRNGIQVASLLAVLGALFLHALFITGFFLMLYFGVGIPHAGRGQAVTPGEEGGSGNGFMIAGEAPPGPAALSGDVKNLLAHAPDSPPAFQPELPKELSTGRDIQAIETASVEPDIIGLQAVSTGELKPRVARPKALAVAPPGSSNEHSNNSVAVASAAGSTGAAAHSPRGGIGDGGDEDAQPVIPLFNAGKGGDGGGHGSKSGRGIDRGESGANNPHPQVLELGDMKVPDSDLRNSPAKNTIYEVTVLPDGTPDKKTIRLVQSCGRAHLDELWKSALLHSKFMPAYAAGKPYTATDFFTYVFNPEDKH